MNHFKIPKLWPFRMVPFTGSDSLHFDTSHYCHQIREHQIKVPYQQKWIKSVTTPLQVEAGSAPDPILLLNRNGATVKTFTWTLSAFGPNYGIYQTTFDVSDIGEDVYYIYLKHILGDTLSEPIMSVQNYPNVLMFRFKNSFNKDDVAWTTGLEMIFMCEADIQDWEPDNEEDDYINQVHDTVNLDGVPFSLYQLYIGDTRYNKSGVAPYIVDILNRIFSCDFISIGRPGGLMKQYNNKSGSKFRITRNRNYPLIGASLDIVDRFNSQSLEFTDTTPLPDGFIAAYNIETGFFGPGSVLPIIEVEENG